MKKNLSAKDLLFIFGTNVVLLGVSVVFVLEGHWIIGLVPLLGLRVYTGGD